MRAQVVEVAALAAALVACSAARSPEPDAHEQVALALAEAQRTHACVAELWRAADLDPDATARLLAVPAAELSPWGGAEPGKAAVREIILARARSAQDDARAARSLALLGEHASSEQDALRRAKAARSLAGSSALCGAAASARSGLLAQRR